MERLSSVDLHVHSALSPCGAEEMRPPATLLAAELRGLGLVGIVDHSTAGNARAYLEAAPAFDVRVLVGMEIESAEGVHIVALFDNHDAVREMDEVVAAHLPGLLNRPDILGPQLLVDEWGEVIGQEERLLIAATDLTLENVALLARERGGLAIPAHIDRAANGLLPTLGFVPPGLEVAAFELSRHVTPRKARQLWPGLALLPLLNSSDAHTLEEIGAAVAWLPEEIVRAATAAQLAAYLPALLGPP